MVKMQTGAKNARLMSWERNDESIYSGRGHPYHPIYKEL
ncbi:hypothetical protein C8D96_2874 [Kushneria marisflavi]|nr:hypothetical protein C8D96_2874 [Kushneria marisflavi]